MICLTTGWAQFYNQRLSYAHWGARVVHWWEHSPPTNMAQVRILASTPYVGWVCCRFSPLLREVFLRVLRFSPLLKNQHFQIPIRSGTHGHVPMSSYKLFSDPWVNKLQITITMQIPFNLAANLWKASKSEISYECVVIEGYRTRTRKSYGLCVQCCFPKALHRPSALFRCTVHCNEFSAKVHRVWCTNSQSLERYSHIVFCF